MLEFLRRNQVLLSSGLFLTLSLVLLSVNRGGTRRFDALKAVVPEQRDVADMLRRIQTLATQSSLVVKAFKPQAIANKELHQEWPMGLELDGTYHNLARFFDQVSKVPRIINVGSIAIKGKKEEETVDGTTITAQCTATTFVLLDKPAPKPGAKPGTPAPAKS